MVESLWRIVSSEADIPPRKDDSPSSQGTAGITYPFRLSSSSINFCLLITLVDSVVDSVVAPVVVALIAVAAHATFPA